MIGSKSFPILSLASLAIAASLAAPVPFASQSAAAQPVVQPLPGPESERLNAALLRLARRPNNLNALIEAGEASIGVGDLDAALGFYGRAREIEGDNAKVSLGLAKVYLRSGRPVEALPLFAQARAAGARGLEIQMSQALALDMVGDHAGAQAGYARALELDPDNADARRRLALSYAISGDRASFEETLAPLLERRDFASFRARAFGLAILGDEARAGAIVDAVMPRNLAQRITPYLEFMPRLTSAQQAAAANLGIFPRASQIGRDSASIAAYQSGTTPQTRMVAASPEGADDRLAPAGTPLNEAPANSASGPISSPVSSPVSSPISSPASPTQPQRVADAFSDIIDTGPSRETMSSSGAVDISQIEAPRETTANQPPKQVHPRRVWVQLATGRDLTALAFDWRRLQRKAPELLGDFDPSTVRWGQTNRLLAGPVADAREARTLVNALNKKGIKTFAYTSPKGQEIQQLEKR